MPNEKHQIKKLHAAILGKQKIQLFPSLETHYQNWQKGL